MQKKAVVIMDYFLSELTQVAAVTFEDSGIEGGDDSYVLNGDGELTHLCISYANQVDFGSIVQHQSLKELWIIASKVKEVPNDIGNLTNLRHLGLWSNEIKSMPASIGNLKNLGELNLDNNQISALPESVGQLQELVVLSARFNELVTLPELIGGLPKLEELLLDGNKLEEIPVSMADLDNLKELHLSKNPIMKCVKEVKTGLSIQGVINYLLSIQHKVTKPLNEAKILVVGDERVGKTSVINRLVGKNCDPDQESTTGIDIEKHTLNNGIRVNIWDFAGQEITHQTHQFFLSCRSLYLLVLDAQVEDNNSKIYHWLSVIKANADDSPIIIVVNKSDLNPGYVFDFHRYRENFNIVDVFYLSALHELNLEPFTKRNIKHSVIDLKQGIECHIKNLEGVDFPLAPNWSQIKRRLERMSAGNMDIMERDDYDNICIEYDLLDGASQQTLLKLLNQIGTVVTYNGSRLSVMQIINPGWVITGVYKIIRSGLIDSTAVLGEAQFGAIFEGDDKYKLRHYTWLVDLLNEFELSFSLKGSEILIPSRLPASQPNFDLFHYQKGLNFRYQYIGLLKKSVISQFIVKMKDYIAGRSVPYWQRGVFLQYGDVNAVVISDEEKKTIAIHIDSNVSNARELLSIIRHTIREINGGKLVAIEEVPLLMDYKIVGYVHYSLLLEADRDNEKEIRLPLVVERGSSHRFSVRELLDGYRLSDDKRFDYSLLTKDLVVIALVETESRQAIFMESEDQTNDRFRNALIYKGYNVSDQSRGGESATAISCGERDLVVRHSKTSVAESVVEAFILKNLDTTVINKHYVKLVRKYDTTGNNRNFILVYAKTQNFSELWEKYQRHFVGFDDTSETYSGKVNVRTGKTKEGEIVVFHIFINFCASPVVN